jgi:PadR family transcriptional regulator, regulatory protein PadR
LLTTALADQPLHGYGVMLAVRQLSDGRLNLRPGTLYAALDRLTEDGLLSIER